jgi:hypothetical protein
MATARFLPIRGPFFAFFAAIPLSVIGCALVADAEHGILHLVDQGTAHGDRNIAEQEQG